MMMQSYQANVAHTTQNAAAPGFLSKYNYKIFFCYNHLYGPNKCLHTILGQTCMGFLSLIQYQNELSRHLAI